MSDFFLSNLLSIFDADQHRPALGAIPGEVLERCQNYVLTQTGDYGLPNTFGFGDYLSVYADADDIRLLSNDIVIERVGPGNNLVLQRGYFIFLRATANNHLVLLNYSNFNAN